jgi:hypothetical protein
MNHSRFAPRGCVVPASIAVHATPRRDLARLEARLPAHTLRRYSQDGSTHWSSRKLTAQPRGSKKAV